MNIQWKHAVLFLCAGFFIGGIVGRCSRFMHPGFFVSPEKRTEWMVKRFSRKLDLNSDQREKVAAIINAKREKIEGLRKDVKPKFDQIRAESRDEIRALLDEGQKKKFDELEARMKKWRELWGDRRAHF